MKTDAEGQYCLALYPDILELWCSQNDTAERVASLPVQATGTIICFQQLPRATTDGEIRRFLAVTDCKESFVWCVDFSPTLRRGGSSNLVALTIELDCQGPFPSHDDLHLVSAVDPMGWRATINPDSLDVYTREVLVTLSKGGSLQTWTTNLSKSSLIVNWLNLSRIQTNVADASLVRGTSERKVAIGMLLDVFVLNGKVDHSGNQLTIWDTKVSRFSVHEEYRKSFPVDDIMQDLDWTSTPDNQSILAVGFPRRVVLFCQQRSDYLNGGSMWISFMSFDMHSYCAER
jgi:rabconnectin-3a